MQYSLDGFKKHLVNLKILPEKRLPYMTWWVKHYQQLGNPEEDEYANSLMNEGRQDWQIRQALDAVNLYNQYIEDVQVIAPVNSDPVESLIEKLKIRHYSKSTVKIYSMWCRKYLDFCEDRKLDDKADTGYQKAFADA